MMVFFGTVHAEAMPWSCPACYRGSDEDLAGQWIPWYDSSKYGVRCRWCGTRFKEHPDGTLVEDRGDV
jgi:hypothetical protein